MTVEELKKELDRMPPWDEIFVSTETGTRKIPQIKYLKYKETKEFEQGDLSGCFLIEGKPDDS